MVRIKICGITNEEDALLAVELGADALGFIFAESPRRIEPEKAKDIIQLLPPFVGKVGVFVDKDRTEIDRIAGLCNLDALQLHGNESPFFCQAFKLKVIKAIRVRNIDTLKTLANYDVDAFLLDAFVPDKHGGTGRTFDWELAVDAKKWGRIILSGGLTPENVAKAIAEVDPYAVDVSSGVEAYPGKKDPEKLRAFFKAVEVATAKR